VSKRRVKKDYFVQTITKKEASKILLPFHYLSSISKAFKSGYNYGLFKNNVLVGVVIFTGFPVPELVKGMFGLERTNQKGFFELSRLCVHPDIQSSEHNIASWFVARAIRALRKTTQVRAILSYADSAYHIGTVYQACNFFYYGLTAKKTDFWFRQADGTYKKHSRGPVKDRDGEWRPRTRKHRYLLVFDRSLEIKWQRKDYV